jgi:hypothetical protein
MQTARSGPPSPNIALRRVAAPTRRARVLKIMLDRRRNFDGRNAVLQTANAASGSRLMRFIFGLIVGIAITVGAALLHDNNVPAGPPRNSPDLTNEPIVNWDTLGAVVREDTAYVGNWWDSLLGRVNRQQQP